MSTRAASAAASRRAKQRLVQLLLGDSKGNGTRPKPDDSSNYTYTELRRAYLMTLQDIHPDKFMHKQGGNAVVTGNNGDSSGQRDDCHDMETLHKKFVELQHAWDEYDSIAKLGRIKSTNSSAENQKEADFTMFGVGCSFADSPAERERRNEIIDQACRGWFMAGELEEKTTSSTSSALETNPQGSPKNENTSLCDDDMFVEVTSPIKGNSKRTTKLSTLIPGFNSR